MEQKSLETMLDLAAPGDKVFTGLFWETISKCRHDYFAPNQSGGKISRNIDPTAFECDGHLVERHAISGFAVNP